MISAIRPDLTQSPWSKRPASTQPSLAPAPAVDVVALSGTQPAEDAPSKRSWTVGLTCGVMAALSLVGAVGCGAARPAADASRSTSTTRTDEQPPVTFHGQRETRLFGNGGSLLPDNAGEIKHMAFQYGNVEFDKPLPGETAANLRGMYRTLFLNMSPDTRFTIVAANTAGETELRALVASSGMEDPERVQIINLEAQKGISIWIRDSMIPVRDADGSWKLLIQDRTYWPGPEDNRVPAIIGEQADGMRAVDHPALRIDGGNMVSTRSIAFIGNDSFQHTTDRLKELAQDPARRAEIIEFFENQTGKDVIESGQPGAGQVTVEQMWGQIAPEVFKSEFRREIFEIGTDDPNTAIKETQPVFHIDMGLTPTADPNTFVVGDPNLAIRTLEALSPAERAQVNREMAEAAGLPADKDVISDLIGVNTDEQQTANFENVARQMREAGYNVVRVPFLTGVRTTWRLPYLTYNNSLQEVYTNAQGQQVRKIYLPVYGARPLDEMATRTYQSLGYEVVPVQMAAVSKLEGAIRCSAYPVQRTSVPYTGR